MVNCDSCGIALGTERIRLRENSYCCEGCEAGGPCVCTYEKDLGRYPPPHYARPVSLAELLDRYEGGIERQADGLSSKKSRRELIQAPEHSDMHHKGSETSPTEPSREA